MRVSTVKNYLDITWSVEATDSKIADILARAESTLNSYAGGAIDFEDETTFEAQLLLDCCRYIWNHALEDFKVNFAPELLALRAGRQVSDYADNEQTEGTDV